MIVRFLKWPNVRFSKAASRDRRQKETRLTSADRTVYLKQQEAHKARKECLPNGEGDT